MTPSIAAPSRKKEGPPLHETLLRASLCLASLGGIAIAASHWSEWVGEYLVLPASRVILGSAVVGFGCAIAEALTKESK